MEVGSLLTVLRTIDEERTLPYSALRRAPPEKKEHFRIVLQNCRNGLEKLQALVFRCSSLGRDKERKFLERIDFARKGKQELRDKLAIHTSSLNMMLTSITHSSLGRLEEMFATSGIGLTARQTRSPPGDVLGAVTRDLELEGIKPTDMACFEDELRDYLRHLARGGPAIPWKDFAASRGSHFDERTVRSPNPSRESDFDERMVRSANFKRGSRARVDTEKKRKAEEEMLRLRIAKENLDAEAKQEALNKQVKSDKTAATAKQKAVKQALLDKMERERIAAEEREHHKSLVEQYSKKGPEDKKKKKKEEEGEKEREEREYDEFQNAFTDMFSIDDILAPSTAPPPQYSLPSRGGQEENGSHADVSGPAPSLQENPIPSSTSKSTLDVASTSGERQLELEIGAAKEKFKKLRKELDAAERAGDRSKADGIRFLDMPEQEEQLDRLSRKLRELRSSTGPATSPARPPPSSCESRRRTLLFG